MRRAVAILIALLLLASPASLLAHGGFVVFDQNVASYGIAVLQSASDQNEVQLFTIYLTEPDSGPPVTGATVTMTASFEGAQPISQVIPPEPDLDGYYDGSVTFPDTGTWQVELAVAGPRGPATANFDVVIPEVSNELNLSIWAVALLPIFIATGVLIYFWLRTGRQPLSEDDYDDDEDEHLAKGSA